jgi:hypothetical protein
MDPQTARTILRNCHAEGDFHALGTEAVDRLLAHADAMKYRKPANANGSRARYFHAYLQRVAAREDAR